MLLKQHLQFQVEAWGKMGLWRAYFLLRALQTQMVKELGLLSHRLTLGLQPELAELDLLT